MTDRRWTKLWRDAWLRRSRSALAITICVVGLAAAGALADTWALVRGITRDGYLASNPVSATLRVDRVDAGLVAAIAALPEVGAVRARRSVAAGITANGKVRRALLVAIDDATATAIGYLRPETGTWPPPPDAVVIERSSLEFSGAAQGESVTLSLGDAAPRSLHVAGVVRDVGVAPGWMENVVYAYVDIATLEKLGASPGFDEVQLRVRDPALDRSGVRRVAEAARSLAIARGIRVRDMEVPEPGRHVHAAQMDSMLLTQGAFAALTLLACAFLIVNLFTALLAEQAREIGVMRALGASHRQVAGMYFGYAASLGLIAALLALPAAVALGYAYARFRAGMLNFPFDGASLPAWLVLLQVLGGVLLSVAAAAAPVLRGCRQPVVVALRDGGHRGNIPTSRRWPVAAGLARPLLLSLGNALRNRSRFVLTALSLASGGAVFLGAASLREAVIASVDRQFESARYDVLLRLGGTPPDDVEARALGVPGVRGAERWDTVRAHRVFSDGSAGNTLDLVGMPAATQAFGPRVASGRWFGPGDGRVLVVGRSAGLDDAELRVGARVRLALGDRVDEWEVVGTVESGLGREIYVPRAALAGVPAAERSSSLAVTFDAAGDAARLREMLDASGVAMTGSRRRGENRRVFEDHLLMVVQFLGAMGWVMLVIGGLGLAGTLGIAVLERRRELGILRSIGARHRDVFVLIEAESIVIALFGWLLALPLSVPIGAALAVAFGRVMFAVPIPWWPPATALGIWLLLSVAIALVAGALPARRTLRMTVAQALAEP